MSKTLKTCPSELLKRITVHPIHHYDELLPLVFEAKGGRGSSTTGKAGGKGKVEEPAAAAKAKATGSKADKNLPKLEPDICAAQTIYR